ncbi:uncharacterized protein LAESUDRAFT_728587 [Laetiporus sulphureus 93-53]|uniref:C2H2-type domain-containing protein n=1 Tax=Laetiporus sulphureus 93-53 TaxID=1314785 RepID=A0A165D0P1_9APHY|nr:uncharacterized protein LAESUDRAFT_728587 [Laetiporus sulphureus 93-53]KZT03900.1 hypothetical protein LAESUDRAFT_728587 [Laetiporus sulphureus 93-53]
MRATAKSAEDLRMYAAMRPPAFGSISIFCQRPVLHSKLTISPAGPENWRFENEIDKILQRPRSHTPISSSATPATSASTSASTLPAASSSEPQYSRSPSPLTPSELDEEEVVDGGLEGEGEGADVDNDCSDAMSEPDGMECDSRDVSEDVAEALVALGKDRGTRIPPSHPSYSPAGPPRAPASVAEADSGIDSEAEMEQEPGMSAVRTRDMPMPPAYRYTPPPYPPRHERPPAIPAFVPPLDPHVLYAPQHMHAEAESIFVRSNFEMATYPEPEGSTELLDGEDEPPLMTRRRIKFKERHGTLIEHGRPVKMDGRFKCAHPGCPWTSDSMKDIRRHQLRHKEKRLQCPRCEKRFGREDSLRRHLRGEKQYECRDYALQEFHVDRVEDLNMRWFDTTHTYDMMSSAEEED